MTTVFDQSSALAGTDDGGGDSGINFREVLSPSVLSAASGNQGTLTLLFGASCPTETAGITSVYIGQGGATAPDFAGDQVQVKFGGSASVNASAGLSVTSDTFTLAQNWDNTKSYVVAFHVTSTPPASGITTAVATSVAGVTSWNSNTGNNDNSSLTHDSTMAFNTASTLQLLEKITIASFSSSNLSSVQTILMM